MSKYAESHHLRAPQVYQEKGQKEYFRGPTSEASRRNRYIASGQTKATYTQAFFLSLLDHMIFSFIYQRLFIKV